MSAPGDDIGGRTQYLHGGDGRDSPPSSTRQPGAQPSHSWMRSERGTATYDGLAIAWAAAEHLYQANKSRALFRHALSRAHGVCEQICPQGHLRYHESEEKWNNSIVFLHEVTAGAADRSYGIHVAKLAGLPGAVVHRAEEVLRALEEGREGHKPLARIDDLPLFGGSFRWPQDQRSGRCAQIHRARRSIAQTGARDFVRTEEKALRVIDLNSQAVWLCY